MNTYTCVCGLQSLFELPQNPRAGSQLDPAALHLLLQRFDQHQGLRDIVGRLSLESVEVRFCEHSPVQFPQQLLTSPHLVLTYQQFDELTR